MRVVLDTNILLSGLMSPTGSPGRLLDAWLEHRFTLVSSEEQLREFRRASRYEHVAKYITQSDAGTLVIEAGAGKTTRFHAETRGARSSNGSSCRFTNSVPYNTLRTLAVMVERLPVVNLSPDPHDDFLLAMAQAGKAHYLVSGDKSGLLSLGKVGNTKIITAAEICETCLQK